MHKDFGEWYRYVQIEPHAETLRLRWEAIEKVSSRLKPEKVADLIRLTAGITPHEQPFVESFMDAIMEIDPTFRRKENKSELAVLSGAVLAHLFSQDSRLSTAAVLLSIAANFDGTRGDTLLNIVAQEAEQVRTTRAAKLREPLRSPTLSSQQLTIEQAEWTADSWSAFQKLLQSFNASQKSSKQWRTYYERRVRLLQEEANIAWWVLGNHSRTLAAPFEALDPKGLPLLLGYELGDISAYPTGLFVSDPVLRKMLAARSEEHPNLRIAEGVLATEHEWRYAVAEERKLLEMDDILPLTGMIKLSARTEDSQDVLTEFLLRTQLDPDVEVEPLRLARQSYYESLAVRALRDLEA